MQCPKCGKPVVAGAKFCMNCGAPMPAEASAQPPTQQMSQMNQMNRTVQTQTPYSYSPQHAEPSPKAKWLAVLAGLAVLALIGVIAARMMGFGVAEKQGNLGSAPNPIEASGKPAGPQVLETTGAPNSINPTTVTGQKPKEPVPPPKEILDWLAHLRQIEMKRREMGESQARDAAILFAQVQASKSLPPDLMKELDISVPELASPDKVADEFNQMNAKWQQLHVEYQAKQPPQACLDVANKYWLTLRDYSAIIHSLTDAMSKNDLQKVRDGFNQRRQLSQQIQETNNALTKLCREYNINQDFNIEQESGMGGLDLLMKGI